MKWIKALTRDDFPKKDGSYFIKTGEEEKKSTFYFAVNAIDFEYWIMMGLQWLDEEEKPFFLNPASLPKDFDQEKLIKAMEQQGYSVYITPTESYNGLIQPNRIFLENE
jgi:hypothetical protein